MTLEQAVDDGIDSAFVVLALNRPSFGRVHILRAACQATGTQGASSAQQRHVPRGTST
jgi:hypothetical protein